MKPVARILLVTVAMTVVIPMPVLVYADNCGLRERITHLEHHIDQKIKDGRLTRDGIRWLERQRHDIQALNRGLRDDGHLSRRNCRVLINRLERLEDNITRLKRSDHVEANKLGLDHRKERSTDSSHHHRAH